MEAQVERLVEKTWAKHKTLPNSQRLLIGVSGIPGSGKTTLAKLVSNKLNERYRQDSPGVSCGTSIAAAIPMDGYHFSRSQLDAMDDPINAHARRGAVFTFDGQSFLDLVKKVKQPLLPETTTLWAPSFDHAIKDPVADDIPIPATVRIVIFEGNYCSLDRKPWKEAGSLMDELWFVNVDFEVAKRRLIRRHIRAGIAADEAAAEKRASENDLVNGKEIVDHRVEVDEIVESIEDDDWHDG